MKGVGTAESVPSTQAFFHQRSRRLTLPQAPSYSAGKVKRIQGRWSDRFSMISKRPTVLGKDRNARP